MTNDEGQMNTVLRYRALDSASAFGVLQIPAGKTLAWITIVRDFIGCHLGATAFWTAPVSWRFVCDQARLPARKRQDTGAVQNAVAPKCYSFPSKREWFLGPASRLLNRRCRLETCETADWKSALQRWLSRATPTRHSSFVIRHSLIGRGKRSEFRRRLRPFKRRICATIDFRGRRARRRRMSPLIVVSTIKSSPASSFSFCRTAFGMSTWPLAVSFVVTKLEYAFPVDRSTELRTLAPVIGHSAPFTRHSP